MSHQFEPFTAEAFRLHTGLNAADNEAVYLRWVNTHVNYAHYLETKELNASMRQLVKLLQEANPIGLEKMA